MEIYVSPLFCKLKITFSFTDINFLRVDLMCTEFGQKIPLGNVLSEYGSTGTPLDHQQECTVP